MKSSEPSKYNLKANRTWVEPDSGLVLCEQVSIEPRVAFWKQRIFRIKNNQTDKWMHKTIGEPLLSDVTSSPKRAGAIQERERNEEEEEETETETERSEIMNVEGIELDMEKWTKKSRNRKKSDKNEKTEWKTEME